MIKRRINDKRLSKIEPLIVFAVFDQTRKTNVRPGNVAFNYSSASLSRQTVYRDTVTSSILLQNLYFD